MVSIIIPIFNEEPILREREEDFRRLAARARLIFVDGGSEDRSIELASRCGQVITSPRGRGVQKNTGAKAAPTDKLLFLHVDTRIDPCLIDHIDAFLDDGSAAGCLTMAIDDRELFFRLCEAAVNGRAKYWGVLDGDSAFFITKPLFASLGGFDETPIMEDVLFGKKLRPAVRLKVLPQTIGVSSRKWHEQGFVTTFGRYCRAYLQLWTGTLSSQSSHAHESKRKTSGARHICERA